MSLACPFFYYQFLLLFFFADSSSSSSIMIVAACCSMDGLNNILLNSLNDMLVYLCHFSLLDEMI